MTVKLQVKEHLRNGALYRPSQEPSHSGAWKHRLLFRHTVQRQLNVALMEKNRLKKQLFQIAVPLISTTFAIAAYFVFPKQVQWLENLDFSAYYELPPIGLKELLVFIALANGLTLKIRKRFF